MQAMRNFVYYRLAAYGALALASLLLGTTTAGAAEIVVTWEYLELLDITWTT